MPHPSQKVRERVFDDASRLDVLLIDRGGSAVIVECKQHAPALEHIKQLRHYLKQYKREIGQPARGILVHGGARNVSASVRNAAEKAPLIELVQYRLDVEFTACR